MGIRGYTAKLGGLGTLKTSSRIEAQLLTGFENSIGPPSPKAAPVLKSQSLTCFKFRILRRPLVELQARQAARERSKVASRSCGPI